MPRPDNEKSARASESSKDDPPRRRRRSRRGQKRSGGLRRRLAVVLGSLFAVGLVVWFVVIPWPRGLDTRNPETTSLMEQRMEEARARGDSLEIQRTWVGLDEISRNLVRAVVVAEDYRFREHEGIDWVSLAEEVEWTGDDDFSWWSPSDLAALADAMAYVWTHRSELRGRSTLTQQLAKNLYFGTDRSLLRKAMEAIVARRLERSLSKDRILELYLNIAEWGPGIFGAETAARAYFGRSASNLTLEQAAALAATLPHPLTSNPARSPARMTWRQELILDRIDPTRQMPAEPMPLPDPDLEIDLPDLDDPEVEVPTVDSAATDTVAPPDSAAEPDTLGGVDALRRANTTTSTDTAASPDTVPPPDTTIRPDTTARPDTVEASRPTDAPGAVGP